jgi:hypothetical protein
VLFGGEVLVWFRDTLTEHQGRTNVTATAMVYPSSNGGAFLKGGFGTATRVRAGIARTGIGTTLGTGYDLKIGRNLYVTPSVDMLVQFFDNSTNTTLLFTMGFTWH